MIAAERQGRRIRRAYLEAVLRQEMGWHDQAHTAEVASRMGINPASLARIEGSLGSRKHSPSLATLRKYAQACGMHLTISLG